MGDFLQNYGIWIAVIGGMLLMHRLGIGCCGGHRPGHGNERDAAPGSKEAEETTREGREGLTPTSRTGRTRCH